LFSLHQLSALGPGSEHAPALDVYVVEQQLGVHSYMLLQEERIFGM